MLFIQLIIRTLIFLSSFFWFSTVFALTVGTHDAPPFSMYEDGEHIGMATEAVSTLLKKCGIDKYDIISYPLARGLAELHDGRIDIYYPYMLENDTEKPYILIGPISLYKIALFVRKDYNREVSFPAMKNLVVAVQRGGVSDSMLHNLDMHVERASQPVSCLRMVVAERVSACVIGTLPGQYAAAINNLSSELRVEDTDRYAEMYVALSSTMSPELVEKIKTTFASLKREKYFEKQQRDYEQKFQLFVKSLS